ncbi:DUF3710 domain-containing protein [Arthrobacter sp. UM1]|uniref:DUF3710 domain-containing protein n=1 Tax=Arthrobacter sp. UM1 TaxID=2766776 RepID=UPI001CF70112|nr:DUF3710 domain-containing protein [Arthrobacter sp. UM1]MCB4207655.1 DUF3710 domain-containing protein [Arthrobacter sp. UM1]
MALFGSRKKKEATTAEDLPAEKEAREDAPKTSAASEQAPAETAAPVKREHSRENGPFDASEKSPAEDAVDLGGIVIEAPEGTHIRLDVDQATEAIVAATVDIGASSLQIQAFAAPKTSGLWEEIRGQIKESVASQGGSSETIDGDFGDELFVKLPIQSQDGSMGYRSARFLGVDGPRWFVRGVLGGPAATDEGEAAALLEIFRSVIVVRGDEAMPPKELLPLTVPGNLQQA